ncbi:MAG: GatB/YqeY domain-containing protein [Bacteroidetes bacterium]|nr:GatB/YqeY domain-containing protein [Bacteroidota bacterium]
MLSEAQFQADLKTAMKEKNQAGLRTLRAIKSAILLAKTQAGGGNEIDDSELLKILQKLAKQREESIAVYEKQGRADLASDEKEELNILNSYLPEPLSDEELAALIAEVIVHAGAKSKADMGKVMGLAIAKANGKADGKRISAEVGKQLS